MIVAPLPDNEGTRQAELDAFDILDTLPEAAYDAVTQLAASICDVPIALISIVDRDRQWFKSRVGLDAAETSRDLAFCAHAILEPEHLLVVPDATVDARFSENPLVTGDPNIRFYAGAPLVTSTGNALGTICVIDRTPRDLTPDQHAALRALAVQVMALLELRWTVMELEDKQRELEEVMRQRETFIATVSHEIRTPLSAVVGYVELLTDPGCLLSPEERDELLGTVGRQAGDVSHLIEDLLVAAKAEAGSLRVQNVDVNLTAQTAQVLEGLDPDQVSSIDFVGGPCPATGDPSRVRQIVRNLVTNAFRYGGPHIRIASGCTDGRAFVEVSDDGKGIPAECRDNVFQPFQQSSGSRVVSDSVGLGLPISRLLAEKMGGSLVYEWRDARSIFRLELPAAMSSPTTPAAVGAAAG